MCVAMIGEIVEIEGTTALCDFEGVLKNVSLALLPMAKVGDDIAVHSGFASEIVANKKKLYRDVIYNDSLSRQIIEVIEKRSRELNNKKLKIAIFSNAISASIEKYSLQDFLPKNILFQECSPTSTSTDESYLTSLIEDKSICAVFCSIEILNSYSMDFLDDLSNKAGKEIVVLSGDPVEIFKFVLSILSNINSDSKSQAPQNNVPNRKCDE